MPMPLSSTVRRRFSASISERDPGFGIVAEQAGVRDRLVAQLLAGVGRVGDQLAQEDVPVRVDRVHHQVQQLGDIGLEGAALRGGRGVSSRHGMQ